MGPRSRDRGMLRTMSAVSQRCVELQWGRGRATAEWERIAAHRKIRTLSLQWGRGRATAEWGRLGHIGGLSVSQASMGPRSRDRGMATTAQTANHADVSFNGAAVARPRNVFCGAAVWL